MLFDPQSRDFRINPYPAYDELREQAPIYFAPDLNMWVFSAYDDVLALLKDRRLGRTMDGVIKRTPTPPDDPLYPFKMIGEHSMFDKEPPDHTRLRSLVHKAFTPKRVENLRGQVQAIANKLLDAVEANGHMDLLAEFAEPLPVAVIAEMLGVPEADRHHLRPWSQAIVAMYELSHTPEQEFRAIQASIEFRDYLLALAAERQRNPGDDLMTALVEAEEAGDRLTADELVSTCVLLLNAGHEATVNGMGNGMLALLRRPDQLAALIANPALVRTALEEMLRYDTPLQLFRRWIREDITYKGQAFKMGTEVALLFGSANRDPKKFENADTFDITRQDNPHIAFGAGVHFCLGAPLARLELEIAIGTLIRRFPTLQLDDPDPEFKDSFVIRGLKQLCVAW